VSDALLDTPADEALTAVLDVETTGLDSSRGHRIIEVAIVRARPRDWRDLERQVVFQSLVDPERSIPDRAIAIHGIEDAELVGQPLFGAIRNGIASHLEDAVFVAQNARFDLGFLETECHLARVPQIPHGPIVDTLLLGRHVFALPRNSLSVLAERTGVPQPVAHRALADARTTLGVYSQMLASLGRPNIPTVRELLAILKDRRSGGAARRRVIETVEAAAANHEELVIHYTSRQGQGLLVTRRRIKVTGVRLPYVDAWCYLRDAERIFRIERIQRVQRVQDMDDEG